MLRNCIMKYIIYVKYSHMKKFIVYAVFVSNEQSIKTISCCLTV